MAANSRTIHPTNIAVGKRRVNQPPRFADRLLSAILKPALIEEILGDLHEYYDEIAFKPRWKRRLFYWFHVFQFFQPFALKKLEGTNKLNHYGMIKNFYFTTVRNLWKHKSYFVINVLGLAIGIASFTFISLYIINELSYDRFHADHQNIYRISNNSIIQGEPHDEAKSSMGMAKVLLQNYPEVSNAVRIQESASLLIGSGMKKINEEGVLFADSSFFSVFDFNLIKGNPNTVLSAPRSMVLSESYAKKYFGNEEPVGKQLSIDNDSTFYTVTGIVEDVPGNSHIKFNMLGSIMSNDGWNRDRWVGGGQHTYVQLADGTDPKAFEEKIQVIFYDYMAAEIEFFTNLSISEWESAGNTVRFVLTPISQIHLYSSSKGELEPTGNISYIYIYGLVGMIILFIALFNFVNLATAHSATRAKEVGVRKVIGSTKSLLVYQFIFESILLALLATTLAAIVVGTFTPSFIDLIGKDLAYGITSHYAGVLFLIGFAVLVGIFAGLYPSFILSAFRPVEVLKGTMKSGIKYGWFRSLLVTVQFIAAIVIMISTIVIYNQVDFMLSKNLGFDKEQILVLERPDWLGNNLQVFKNELTRNPDIEVVAGSETIPGKEYLIRSYRKKDHNEVYLFLNNQVDYDHLSLMGIELIAGRFFSKEFRSDSNAVVVNQSAVKKFGFEDPIGQPLTSAFKKDRPLKIIGVVKDYHMESLRKSIVPVTLELSPGNEIKYLNIRLNNTINLLSTLEYIEDTWQEHTHDKPINYYFFDDDYQKIYQTETSTGRILLVFAFLSVFIACMGLIGLISYTASVRRKEMGIRKVLGAGPGSLVRLLSSDIFKLVMIATLVAWPAAYLAMDYWLQNFANRITMNPLIYVTSTIAVILFVSVAIGFQTIKAALSNPVDSLRSE